MALDLLYKGIDEKIDQPRAAVRTINFTISAARAVAWRWKIGSHGSDGWVGALSRKIRDSLRASGAIKKTVSARRFSEYSFTGTS